MILRPALGRRRSLVWSCSRTSLCHRKPSGSSTRSLTWRYRNSLRLCCLAKPRSSSRPRLSDYKAIREWADGQLNSIGVPAELHETVLAAAADMEPVWTANGQQLDLAGAWQQTLAFVEKFADIPQVRNSLLDSYQKTKQAPHVSHRPASLVFRFLT